jgi:hypothetical protein
LRFLKTTVSGICSSGSSDIEWLGAMVIDSKGIRSEGFLFGGRLRIESGLFKCPPFVIFLVSFANDIPLLALGAGRFGLVAF